MKCGLKLRIFNYSLLVKCYATCDVTAIYESKRSLRSQKLTTVVEPVNLFTIISVCSEASMALFHLTSLRNRAFFHLQQQLYFILSQQVLIGLGLEPADLK